MGRRGLPGGGSVRTLESVHNPESFTHDRLCLGVPRQTDLAGAFLEEVFMCTAPVCIAQITFTLGARKLFAHCQEWHDLNTRDFDDAPRIVARVHYVGQFTNLWQGLLLGKPGFIPTAGRGLPAVKDQGQQGIFQAGAFATEMPTFDVRYLNSPIHTWAIS